MRELNIKIVLVIVFCAGFFTLSANATDRSAYINWLASGWGETNENGTPDSRYSCSRSHDIPASLEGKAKGRAIYPNFYDGVLAFVNVDGNVHVISGYKKPLETSKPGEDILDFLKRSQSAVIPVTIGTDSGGRIQLELGTEIPNIPYKRTIIPLTNDSFKLAAPANKKGGFGGASDYYFKRCGG